MKRASFAGAFLLLLLAGCTRSCSDDKGTAKVEGSPTTPQGAASSTTAPFTVEQCEGLLIDAERKLAEERSRAPTDCKKDDDCKLVDTSACIPACTDRAIAKKGIEAYGKRREELRMSSCKLWNDAECARTTPKPQPQCAPMKAVCKANHCEVVAADAK